MKRPKRRRYNDNPYYLKNIGDKYIIEFKNSNNKVQSIMVNKSIYDIFDRFELDDLKELNEYDRHIEHSEILDGDLYKRASYKIKLTEDIVENLIELKELQNALNSLSQIQIRRIKMYYYTDLTLREIAEIENCSVMSVKASIDTGIKKLKKILKKNEL